MSTDERYRNMIADRIRRITGFSPDPGNMRASQRGRISDLAEVLHQCMVIDQMVRAENMTGRRISSRISSRVRPSRSAELKQTEESLDVLKSAIWKKCDIIAGELLQDKEAGYGESAISSSPPRNAGNLMKCHACGNNVEILAYNNYKCNSCGLGYSARDYLDSLSEIIENL